MSNEGGGTRPPPPQSPPLGRSGPRGGELDEPMKNNGPRPVNIPSAFVFCFFLWLQGVVGGGGSRVLICMLLPSYYRVSS